MNAYSALSHLEPTLLPAWARPGLTWVRARVFDTSAWFACQVDDHERGRRAAHGLSGLHDLNLIDTLMTLPAGLPVPMGSLDATTRAALRRMPPGVVDIGDGQVVRAAVPVLNPLLAIVRTDHWRTGLLRASRFAAYCSRLTLLRSAPEDIGPAVALARRGGVGLAVSFGREAEVIVEPEAVADWQPTAAAWWFSEAIFHELAG
ncbi:hypothetical protein JOD54_002557 [Actinokineospora baliensis]|uniref:hypothetical protein n=1 Tax=Actinokineospora baliensis TaxID=547056 RepID=UPI00195C1B38|nr:hypothetical protein [Actinokineospora baliensis]MBM7772353.1 hypothetical protein [Actinokineospora baliensis]